MAHPSVVINEILIPGFLSGGGETGQRIRDYKWADTSIGTIDTWPQSLRSALSICLNSNFPIAIYWGKDLTLLYNEAWSPIPGDKHPWALGKRAKEVWPEIWDAIEPQFQKAFNGEPGGSKNALLPMQRHGYTEECYFDFTFTPIYGEGGKVEGVFNAVIETTKNIINERQLQTLTSLGKALIDSGTYNKVMEDTIYTLKQNPYDFPFALYCTIQNKNAVCTYSTPLGEGDKLIPGEIDLTADSDLAGVINKAIATKKLQVIENVKTKIGNLPKGAWEVSPDSIVAIPVMSAGAKEPYGILLAGLNPLRIPDENYTRFFSLIADQMATSFTQVQAREEEREKAEALAAIDKAKTAFFTNISHEFRTPLTLMLGTVEEALNDPNTNPENVSRLSVTHRNAVRLLKLVNTLLDFSRLEAGRVKASLQLTDIAVFTTSLAANFRSAIENAGLQFEVVCKAAAPVYIDKEMWEKIVFNLLSNAFKYTLKGSITLSLTAIENKIELKIKDTGIGIPKEELPKMFQRFHRVQNSAGRTYEGTGIGLSLVKELVQLHRGEITVNSREGEGSEFIVTMPATADHLHAGPIVEEEPEADEAFMNTFLEEITPLVEVSVSENNTQLKTDLATVLVVDDNADMRGYIKGLLQKQFNVITAGNGAEGLHHLKQNKVDVVVSDIMMPVMDGAQLLKAIKEAPQTSTLPVILVSARAGDEAKVEGFDIGADDYLTKPFSAKELLARVRSQVNIAKKRAGALEDVYGLFEELPFAVAVLKGEDLVIEFANQYTRNIWQQKKEVVLGRPLFDVVPETRPGAEPMHAEVQRTRKRLVTAEVPVEVTTNGKTETRYFNSIIDPMFNERGEMIGQLATTIEITEQVVARKKIEEIEVRFRSLAENSPDIIARHDKDLRYLYVNPRIEEFTFIKPEVYIGKTYREIGFPEKVSAFFDEQLTKVFTTKKPQYLEYEKIDVPGTYVYSRMVPEFNQDGEVASVLVLTTDVTTQKIAEKELKEGKERLQASLNASQTGTFRWNIQTNELSWDENLDKLFGLPPGQTLQSLDKFIERVHADDQQGVIDCCRHCATEGADFDMEFRVVWPDGTVHWLDDKGKTYLDDKGQPFYMTGACVDITDHKLATEKIRTSEQRFQAAINAVEGILWTNNAIGEMEGEQPGWSSLTGQSFSEYQGYGWAQAIHPDDAEPTVNAWNEAVRERKTFVFEHRVKRKDGSWGHYSVRAIPLLNGDGSIREWVGVHTDVTVQRKAAAAIKDSETRFRTLAETLPQMVWMRRIDGEIEYFSQSWYEYSGIKNINEAWRAMVHPDEWELIMKTWEKSIAESVSFRYDVRLKNKAGEYRWHNATGEPVYDGAGHITKWIGALNDIHAQKTFAEKLEKEVSDRTRDLQNSQSFLQQLIDSSVEYISVLDKNLDFITVNKRYEDTAKMLRKELVGKNLFDVSPKAKDTLQHESIIKALKGETVYLDKRPAVAHPDIYVDTYFIPFRVRGNVEGVIIMSRDVTAIVQSERLLEQMNMELQRSNEDLQQFAHVASHDLKEPVRKVRTFSSRLKEEYEKDLPDKGKLYLNKIEAAADRMYAMIDGVLMYSSFNAMPKALDNVNLNVVLHNIESDLEILIAQKKAVIKYESLPFIKGSSILIYQLFYNLINNSLKFAKVDVPPEINLRPEKKPAEELQKFGLSPFKEYVAILIEDNGIGFNQKDAEKIFQTFSRLNSKDKYEGTGLGLALCKKIVERHGGVIFAEGKEGEGARITVILPAQSDSNHF